MICFQISIFEPLETTFLQYLSYTSLLWFAFKLVSLNHWKQHVEVLRVVVQVVICFQISIFEPLETTAAKKIELIVRLWFAFKLVSLNHWKQPVYDYVRMMFVVICFQISIFEPLETTIGSVEWWEKQLWFAFKLVSLNHWKQLLFCVCVLSEVVICFQISIFEPLETTSRSFNSGSHLLWFAFKLVSLNHWKQHF